MIVEPTAIPEVILLITPPRFLDARGFFSETWNERRFTEAGIPGPFVQDNHARVGRSRRGARAAPADRAERAGQADPRRAWRDLGCRGGHPARLADLWPACRRRAVGGELAAALDPGRTSCTATARSSRTPR